MRLTDGVDAQMYMQTNKYIHTPLLHTEVMVRREKERRVLKDYCNTDKGGRVWRAARAL